MKSSLSTSLKEALSYVFNLSVPFFLFSFRKMSKNKIMGVPVVARQKQILLVSMRMRVQSLAPLSGLRMQHWHRLWCKLQMQLRSSIAGAVVQASTCSSNVTSSPRCGPKKGGGGSWVIIFLKDLFYRPGLSLRLLQRKCILLA